MPEPHLDNNVVEPSAAVVLKSIVVDLEESKVRLIKIKEGGTELGKSVKIRNFHLDLLSMTELIATTLITVADPVVAGVLLIITGDERILGFCSGTGCR